LAGYKIPTLKTFRKFCGLAGHPEIGIDGVTATTGPLGQGIGNAVGIALAKKIKGAKRKSENGNVYCLCSDGDLMEGVAQEAIAFAGIYRLNNLVMLWDDNQVSIDGEALTDLDIPARMHAAGWNVLKTDGNNFKDIDKAISVAKKSVKPLFIQCKTVIGLGTSVAGTSRAHAFDLGDSELLKLEEKFTSTNGLKLWARVAKQKIKSDKKIVKDKDYFVGDISFADNISTRELSGKCIEKLLKVEPLLVGGSADLAGSTKTKTLSHYDITADDFSGNFINYGVREHAMGAIMNGLCIAGLRPYGGTFLIFSDYMRPAIRLSALSKLPVIYVLTHDSIALGEDGPTHQPIEQLESLRLIPNLNVFRPFNAAEVVSCWEQALSETKRPSCIILSRQEFAQISTIDLEDIKKGGYVIKPSDLKRTKITLIATGSEVPLAVEVANKLKNAQVVSMPSVEKFRTQPVEYKNKVLVGYIVAIEAGATAGWFEFADAVMGIDEFGATGSGNEVYKHFGFDAEIIAAEIIKKLK
jgi:transketolase